MDELKKAIEIRDRYNKLSFDEFFIRLEKYLGKSIPEEDKDMLRFTGLCNTDFFLLYTEV